MSVPVWNPSVEPSSHESKMLKQLQKSGKFYRFLRLWRHKLFDDAFQAELAKMYSADLIGTAPVAPALLAMVTLLQAKDGASDAKAVDNARFDLRWQIVLDCVGCDTPPFSQGVLVSFRRRLIEHEMDRRLLERTVELAKTTGAFGHKMLRIALDSAPLWGAGRVEDTFNLIGHAMEIVVECAAVVAGMSPEAVRAAAGTKLLGQTSIKAALDIDWDDQAAKQEALERLLEDVGNLRSWVAENLAHVQDDIPLKTALEALAQVIEQDIEPDPDGGGSRIRKGTAKDRRISIVDSEMRHGRKSKSRVINGYKRHIATELDSGLIVAATVRPANEKEHAAEDEIRPDAERLGEVIELHIDRGYLAGSWPQKMHKEGRRVVSKPWTNNTNRFGKGDFEFDFNAATVRCPAGQITPITRTSPNQPERATFSSTVCRDCTKRSLCLAPKAKNGRSLALHPQEPLLVQLRELKKTPDGRKVMRERVAVEHSLAHICSRQGQRARYIGARMNTFDLRRTAAVQNLHVILRKAC